MVFINASSKVALYCTYLFQKSAKSKKRKKTMIRFRDKYYWIRYISDRYHPCYRFY